jgi:hypothetical protein
MAILGEKLADRNIALLRRHGFGGDSLSCAFVFFCHAGFNFVLQARQLWSPTEGNGHKKAQKSQNSFANSILSYLEGEIPTRRATF